MKDNVIIDKTLEFSIRIVNMYKYLCKEQSGKYGFSKGKTMKSLSTYAFSFLMRPSLDAHTFGAM